MKDNLRDSWGTPQDLFSELDKEFKFLIDACATETNSKCQYFIDDAAFPWQDAKNLVKLGPSSFDDTVYGLSIGSCTACYNKSIFMNPPYSNAAPFLKRAWEFSEHMTVVCLVPSRMIHNKNIDFLFEEGTYRKPKDGLEIRFLSKRTHFIPPEGVKASSPSFGCMLLIMDRRK